MQYNKLIRSIMRNIISKIITKIMMTIISAIMTHNYIIIAFPHNFSDNCIFLKLIIAYLKKNNNYENNYKKNYETIPYNCIIFEGRFS